MTVDWHFRVLLVEDNPMDTRMIRRAFSEGDSDVELVHVADLASALETIDDLFDAVLVDLSLPDSDGLDSLAGLLATHPGSPVIVLTGLDDPDVAMRAMEQGAQDWLTKKTITPELLERAVRYAVARHHSETELRIANSMVETLNTREQIAGDLHDTVIQRLFATGMNLQGALASKDADLIERRAGDAVDEIDGAIQELREAIFGLHRPARTSFDAELEAIVARHRDAFSGSIAIDSDGGASLPASLRHDVLAIIAEAVANAARHAQANSVEIVVRDDAQATTVTVTDDGVGLQGSQSDGDLGDSFAGPAPRAEASHLRGNGLRNMARRARRHGGRCIVSPGPERGTVVTATIPR